MNYELMYYVNQLLLVNLEFYLPFPVRLSTLRM